MIHDTVQMQKVYEDGGAGKWEYTYARVHRIFEYFYLNSSLALSQIKQAAPPTDLHLLLTVRDISAGCRVIYAVNVATGRQDEEIWDTTERGSSEHVN